MTAAPRRRRAGRARRPTAARPPRAGAAGGSAPRVRMIAALILAGGIYTVFAPGPAAQDDAAAVRAARPRARRSTTTSCISCHGRNAQGVRAAGPSLIGVGSAAVEFQVNTGRMPAARQEAQAERKHPVLHRRPGPPDRRVHPGARRRPAAARGRRPRTRRRHRPRRRAVPGQLLLLPRLRRPAVARCPPASTRPSLDDATDRQIYAAMLTGPQNMPVFGDNQLTPGGEARRHRLRPGSEAATRTRAAGASAARPGHRGPGDLPGRHRRPGLRDPVDCG